MRSGFIVTFGLAALMAVGCGAGEPQPGDAGAADSFIAFAGDFASYKAWQSYSSDGDGGSIHASGPRTEYINRAPPSGSTAFPVGTIILKDIVAQRPHLFAMVKRGGNYNVNGAKGWEWFDIVDDGHAPPSINWRGFGPPSGETYGGDPTACNACHAAATNNDSVLSPKVQLSNF